MEHEGSCPCSQEPTTSPSPEPDESSPHPHIHFFNVHFNITRPSMPRSPK